MLQSEISSIMEQEGMILSFANKVRYNEKLSAEEKEVKQAIDAWAKDVGSTGYDEKHSLSAMVKKSISRDSVSAPSELIEAGFDTRYIGEFDDTMVEKEPENTIQVHDSILGGNVDRSYFDFTVCKPKWGSLQAETEISLEEMRRGGYKTVTTAINYISEALENTKTMRIMNTLDLAILQGADNYFTEVGTVPSDVSMRQIALYLQEVADGDTPAIFGLNKYIQSVALLPGVTEYLTDEVKNQYNRTGRVTYYAGSRLFGLSGQKKLADGTTMIPNQRLFGFGGKVGEVITRGEAIVQQETLINKDRIHIKVNGFSFGTVFTDLKKAVKLVIS